MGFYSIKEKEKWSSYIQKQLKKYSFSNRTTTLLANLTITDLDYGEYKQEGVEGGEVIVWSMDFTYNNKEYYYRRSEVLETGEHLCYGYSFDTEDSHFDKTLLNELNVPEHELQNVLDIFETLFYELDSNWSI